MDEALARTPVTYAAVGATRAPDVLAFPPAGFRVATARRRIGHGEHRFAFATTQLLSWGIQRRSGMRVRALESPEAGPSYRPVVFDDEGAPAAPARSVEQGFAADGTALVSPGDTVELVVLGVRAPVRVIYVLDEPTRRGFAFGTLPGHPACGEEAFTVELSGDGSVWLTITSLSRPADGGWKLIGPVLRGVQALITRRYLRALSGPIT